MRVSTHGYSAILYIFYFILRWTSGTNQHLNKFLPLHSKYSMSMTDDSFMLCLNFCWIRIQSYDSFLPVFLWLLYTLFASNFDGYHSMQLLSNIIVLLQHLLRQSSLLQMAFLLVHDFAKVNHVFLSNQSLHSSINVSTLKANIISDVKACVRSSRLKKKLFF